MTSSLRFAVVSLAVALVACGNEDPGGPGEAGEPVDFEPGQGQTLAPEVAYAPPPYGVSVGSVIQNFQFIGYANAQDNPTGELQTIRLSDFYNPTGDGTFAEGSLYPAGSPKPKALLIVVSAVWCGPCNYEADVVLPVKYAKYKPMGGEFLLELADGPTPGEPATVKNLDNWTSKYDVDYPSSLDPANKLAPLYDSDAFPNNFIVDTRTMRIVEVVSGAPEDGGSFWSTFEATLAGSN